MGRGSSNGRPGAGGGGTRSARSWLEAELTKADAPIDPSKTGANFRSLPKAFQKNIEDNLKLSDTFKTYARAGTPLQDEWTTSMRGVNGKRKVLTDLVNGRINYTVKDRNKILLQTTNKNQVANKIAEF